MSEGLAIRPSSVTRWDCVALGEVMLRFDPEFGRVREARRFRVWEGGGEYNVARAMRKCFGLRAAVVTALPDSELGRLTEDLIQTSGVDTSHVRWRRFDGVGRSGRVGLNFTEKGYGGRAALGCVDRGHSAAAQMRPGEIDWDALFGREGVRWFHTGGIFAGLSSDTAAVAREAVQAARRCGTVVSYDLNFRASLWKDRGGAEAARAVNRAIAPFVDVMIGNQEDFVSRLGLDVVLPHPGATQFDPENGEAILSAATTAYPGLRVAATTLRDARTAGFNDWGGLLWAGGEIYRARPRRDLEIYDRMGGGDAFASGLAWAFLTGRGPQAAVDCGVAHGALAMTSPGDVSTASADEVLDAVLPWPEPAG
ncbi:sugar kinase [Rhodoplanes sp. TEM]|uniref:Sugar kinase n=1 Tax=Rhodoplanes tepidamans TaxID=200616 RepID=A0ABT5JE01_RHOTP|nr:MULTISPECIES: sugar kinase [Rhodoplanes]MDC7787873.1 sugar kinase [Rhodoplanes tepidamans]MDC7985668.1 sugar kinase [Rhodoplanes sp. TEM]MDQ0357864.1 2-dehydro-3-deoxygluconokinase [Rhodoplanes tepidamans]